MRFTRRIVKRAGVKVKVVDLTLQKRKKAGRRTVGNAKGRIFLHTRLFSKRFSHAKQAGLLAGISPAPIKSEVLVNIDIDTPCPAIRFWLLNSNM